ncbi:sugar ABC transporter permease [Oceanobacillus arenosus]|uniref:Sugar ABC transporter permease n=1 Tax=Oceanobacillus arenosus TaxID=1229153 RepID=A0A3D8PTQ1_9BACI|nr:sugar ABC transporter permease [Oceanobacillus arenosus]RDW18345.1 sugar ABC transporter permease [Oceanobacillus arenosus]
MKKFIKRDIDKPKLTIRTFLEPLLFLAPFLIGIIIFTVYPFINVLLISFQEGYNFLSQQFLSYGLENYRMIFQDENFINSLKNTGIYMFTVVPISTALAIIIAVLLNQKIKFNGVFQTAYFLPMVTSVTAVGLVWKWMYNFDYGIINYLLTLFNVDAINWLNDPKYNMPALIIYGIWSILPFTIILLLSGLQNINEQYYVAARADGAKPFRIFRRITVPLLAPTIGLVLIINIINTSKVFDELFPLFNGRPGSAYSLYTVVYYLYDMFYVKWELGPAAASATILFILVFILTMIQLFIQRKWSNY